MKLARIAVDGEIHAGEYRDGAIVTEDDRFVVGEDGDLVPPCDPSALYCVGRNFAETLDQMEYDVPDQPAFFIKPPASMIAHEEPIPYPTFSDEVTYAGELAAVIGERCHRLDEDEVSEVIRGYTIMNDVDALDQPGRTAR
ncbi:MAG: fumarylacetoacetate hydrolase family protein, partial [Haloplanus sp.]